MFEQLQNHEVFTFEIAYIGLLYHFTT